MCCSWCRQNAVDGLQVSTAQAGMVLPLVVERQTLLLSVLHSRKSPASPIASINITHPQTARMTSEFPSGRCARVPLFVCRCACVPADCSGQAGLQASCRGDLCSARIPLFAASMQLRLCACRLQAAVCRPACRPAVAVTCATPVWQGGTSMHIECYKGSPDLREGPPLHRKLLEDRSHIYIGINMLVVPSGLTPTRVRSLVGKGPNLCAA